MNKLILRNYIALLAVLIMLFVLLAIGQPFTQGAFT